MSMQHRLNLGYLEQERFYRRRQNQTLREDQRRIQTYYTMNMRTMNRVKVEVILGTVILLLAISVHLVTPKAADIFGFRLLRLLLWLQIATIFGIIFLVLLQVTYCGIISALIRIAWNRLISRQKEYTEYYIQASQNLTDHYNQSITAVSVRTLLHAIGRDMTSPESKSKYGIIPTTQEETSFQGQIPDDQIRYLNFNGEQFLVQADNPRSYFVAICSGNNVGFDTFMVALAEIAKSRQGAVIEESYRILVDIYTDKLIQKIEEHVKGDWCQMRDAKTFYDFIKSNWNYWFPQKTTLPAHLST